MSLRQRLICLAWPVLTGCGFSTSQPEIQATPAAKASPPGGDTLPHAYRAGGAVVINAVDKGDYFYIPYTAFADTIDAVLYPDKLQRKVKPENRPVTFAWTSNCNDGYYKLTVTPEQILLSSGHDNPNPNYVFWAIPISREQFRAINAGVRKKGPDGFFGETAAVYDSMLPDESRFYFHQTNFQDPCTVPENWNKSTQQQFASCCDTVIKRQTAYYFRIWNNYITAELGKGRALQMGDILITKPKFFSDRKDQLREWAARRIKK